MSLNSSNIFEDNFFSSGNDDFSGSLFRDNKEFSSPFFNNPMLSFYEEEPQQDLENKDYLYEDIDRNDEDLAEKQSNPKKDKQGSSTGPTSDKKGEIKIKKVADKFKVQNQSRPNYWRFDMVKKHFKTKFSEYGTNTINELIQKSDLPEYLKRPIHTPNSPKFTANIKVSDNFHFLNDTLRTIYTIGNESKDLQKQNEEIIKNIYKFFERIGYNKLSENMRNIKNFFEMRYKDLIKNFYDSVEFKSFKEDYKTKFYDEGTIKQEGFSLLENYGLITLFSMLKKKRRRD